MPTTSSDTNPARDQCCSPARSGTQTPANDAQAEQAAADHLQLAGLTVLNRNWQCAEGTIDIVAAEQRVLVVCQLQVRSAAASRAPARTVSRARQRRLRRLGLRWMIAHGVLFDEIRIDIVTVQRARTGGFTVEHLRGMT